MGVAPERTRTVHVWSAKDEIVPMPREENPLVDELGVGGRFVVMYSGNAGIVHDFRDVLEAMRLMKDDERFHFLFVGDGPRRPEIEAFVRQHDIRNFEYRPYFARDQLRWSLSLAHVHLISLRAPFVGISVPGKLYGIMAAARPALFVGPERCESAETILAARCGAVVDPEQGRGAARVVDTLRAWADASETLTAMGDRGRHAFERIYEREPNCREFVRIVREQWASAAVPESLGDHESDGRRTGSGTGSTPISRLPSPAWSSSEPRA